MNEEIGAEHAGVEVPFVFHQDDFLEFLLNGCHQIIRDAAGHQRQHLVGFLIQSIHLFLGIIERRVDQLPGLVDFGLIFLSLLGLAQGTGAAFENLPQVNPIAVVEDLTGGFTRPVLGIHAALGRHPVAQKPGWIAGSTHQPIRGLYVQKRGVTTHRNESIF